MAKAEETPQEGNTTSQDLEGTVAVKEKEKVSEGKEQKGEVKTIETQEGHKVIEGPTTPSIS